MLINVSKQESLDKRYPFDGTNLYIIFGIDNIFIQILSQMLISLKNTNSNAVDNS